MSDPLHYAFLLYNNAAVHIAEPRPNPLVAPVTVSPLSSASRHCLAYCKSSTHRVWPPHPGVRVAWVKLNTTEKDSLISAPSKLLILHSLSQLGSLS